MLKLAYYDEDKKILNFLKASDSTVLKNVKWNDIVNPTDLYRFYINGSLITFNDWQKVKMPDSGQKVYQSIIDLTTIPQ
jgi:hypothetical protein